MRRAMVLAALALWAAALVVWALGWTSSLSALSLTAPEGVPLELALLEAAVVLLTWLGAVMVAPVLLLTSVTWTLILSASRPACAPR